MSYTPTSFRSESAGREREKKKSEHSYNIHMRPQNVPCKSWSKPMDDTDYWVSRGEKVQPSVTSSNNFMLGCL